MKKISLLAVSVIFAAVFAVSAFAQNQPGAGRIGWINTREFAAEKDGVTKYIAALKTLDGELKPSITELQTIQNRVNTLSDDLAKMQSNPAVPIDQKAAQAKADEGQRLQREFDFKKKEYDAKLEKRSAEILGPVSADITKAIQEFAKQKGYVAILDITALAEANVILALDDSANITKEFIAYYNTRPSTTATTATPK